ncbi:MAG: c-type cytochrome [Candidatus Korobacteraceae bacterium]
MTKRMFAVGVPALLLAVVVLAVRPTMVRAGASAETKTAAQQFKNIQVLKDIPADQLVPTMQFISASLGVECDFCHVEREMDKDDKKTKKTAREMMRMMAAINQNNFSGEREVTCNTCHRGAIHPQAVPAIAMEAPKQAVADSNQDDAAARASWPSGNAVIAKYLEAAGGTAALEKVATRVEKGNALLGGGRKLPIEVFAKSPDMRVSVMHTQNGESVTAYNGHAGWLATPGRPLHEMSASDQYAARLDATVMFPTHLAAMFAETRLQPHPEEVDGHAATVVWGISKGEPPVKFYFDPQSGLLVRMLHYTDTALGLNPTQVDYADYRDAGGVKTPYRWTIARPSGAFTIQLDEVQSNAPIDASRFEEPPSPPPGTDAPASPH